MKKFLLVGGLVLMLGTGCTGTPPSQSQEPDAAINAAEENCRKSGGTPQADFCDCPDGYLGDPAGFCLDASGKPGGSMPAEPASP